MRRKLFILLFILTAYCYSNDINKIMNVLKYVETNNNVYAVGDGGKAYGVLQIHKICVDDVNRIYDTDYTHEDMFNPECAKEVFTLYINAGIKRFENLYNRSPTEKDIVRMWNGGIYKGYRYRETIKYYNRYLTFKNKLN